MSMDNKYVNQLYDVLRNRYSIDAVNMGYGEWISKNTRLAGKPFSFSRYPFQQAIADDMHPTLSCIKCSQIGLTEVQLRKAAAFAYRNNGVQVGYTLPEKDLRDAASKTRMNTILNSRVFTPEQSRGWIRSVETKQIANSFVHMMIAVESKAFSLPLDFLILDELDLTDTEIAVLLNSRLQNSDFKIRHDFSTPTFPDFGIDARYQMSDQREYLVRCPCCRHEQFPTFDNKFVHFPGLDADISVTEITREIAAKLDLSKAYVWCEKCHSALDLQSPQYRRWVARRPDVTSHRGYRVNPFSTGRLSPEYIIKQKFEYERVNFIRGWHNTVLGETYKDENIQLSEATIKNAMVSPEPLTIGRDEPIVVGIDMGKMCHVVKMKYPGRSKHTQAVALDIVPRERLEDYVTQLCANNRVIMGAIDRYPYTPTANNVFQISQGKIWPIEYIAGPEARKVEKELESDKFIQADRTVLLDRVAKSIRDQTLTIYGYGTWKELYIQHLRNMVRDEKPDEPAVWRKLDSADHFFHATGLALFSTRIIDYLDAILEQDNRMVVGIVPVNTPAPHIGMLDPKASLYPRIG